MFKLVISSQLGESFSVEKGGHCESTGWYISRSFSVSTWLNSACESSPVV